jgi:hypothetical protein
MLDSCFFCRWKNRVVTREVLLSHPAVLAMELSADSPAPRRTLTRDEAASLAGLLADDLRALLPGVEQAHLAVVGAHFDSVELLRPGFPVFATLDELAGRLPGAIAAFGSHDGRMPALALEPEPDHAGGPLRLLPWTLMAPPAMAGALDAAMETELVGRGETGMATADFLMRTLGMRLEHARYFTRHDLLALACVQYEHANLGALWTMLEAALLTPDRPQSALSAHGMALRFADGRVHAPTPGEWLAAQPTTTPEQRAHALAGMIFELRQYVALLAAHHLPLAFDGGDYDPQHAHLVEVTALADPAPGTATLHAHDAPGLGVIAISVVQPGTAAARVLARGYPLAGNPDALRLALARRYACEPVFSPACGDNARSYMW